MNRQLSKTLTKTRQAILTSAHKDFQKGLTTHAFFKTHDHDRSDDLVQDTFLKTGVYLLKGGKIDIMRAFLYHVLNNLIIDDYRKRKPVSLEVLQKIGFEPSVDDTDSLADNIDGRDLLQLIEELPATYRNVMRMRYVQLLSHKEIATLTNQTKNAVTVQLHRGLIKLRVLYKGTEE